MRRNALGIVAAFLLVIGFVSMLGGPGGESAKQFSGVCVKSGLVLGALWLALPQITAILASSPRRLLGWFVGKTQQSKKVSPTAPSKRSQPEHRPPAQSPPRPRRRSNQ